MEYGMSSIKIYSCEKNNCNWFGERYSFAIANGFNSNYYELIYECEDLSLEDAIAECNGDFRSDFYGPDLHISDIIECDGNLYYMDKAWFVHIPDAIL